MKYRRAFDRHGVETDIVELDHAERRRRGPFSCIGCGQEMLAILGDVRERHYRHCPDTNPSACPGETYLHKLAKRQVVQGFREAVASGTPYNLTLRAKKVCEKFTDLLGHPCEQFEQGERVFDLTKLFDNAEEEKAVEGGFMPDVLLSHSRTGKKLLIEILVSHALRAGKACQRFKYH